MPLMTPVPFLFRPERLNQAACTFITAVFQRAYTPTVRSALVARPAPLSLTVVSTPRERMKKTASSVPTTGRTLTATMSA